MGEDLPMETNVPGGGGGAGGVAAANMLLGNTTVAENSKVPQLSLSEYFSPPKNPKEYDGMWYRLF